MHTRIKTRHDAYGGPNSHITTIISYRAYLAHIHSGWFACNGMHKENGKLSYRICVVFQLLYF